MAKGQGEKIQTRQERQELINQAAHNAGHNPRAKDQQIKRK